MPLRPFYLIFVRACGRLVLPGRSSASKDAGLLVLRHEVAVLRRTNPAAPAGLGRSRGVLAALIRQLPERCGHTGMSPRHRPAVAPPPGEEKMYLPRTGRDGAEITALIERLAIENHGWG